MSGEQPITVALDGRGAENGPAVVVDAVRAVTAEGISVRVFGLREELSELDGGAGVELIEAPDVIGNDEEPVVAVRSKDGASVVMAARDVAEGRSDALVSPGATGATMAAATLILRRIHGVNRPALALELRTPARPERPVLLLDVGASTEARAQHLIQFAHLGSAFAESVLGLEDPSVALLSVGEEATKGTPELVEAHAVLATSAGIGFRGNVEGGDILAGTVDVVVTDGFTGNVVLKTIEGTAKVVAAAVSDAARSNPVSMVGGALLRPALGGLRAQLDPDATGGAILLGLRATTVVGHGSAGASGIANAIRLAARAVRVGAVERTAEALERSGATRSGLRDRKL